MLIVGSISGSKLLSEHPKLANFENIYMDEWIPDDEESISLRHVAMMIVQLREAGGNLESINSSLLPRTKQ